MRRETDLCRDILLQAEARNELPWPPKWTPEQLCYHVELLVEGGLVEADLTRNHRNEVCGFQLNRLTWQGHDLLDGMRDESVWAKVRETVQKNGGGWTFDLLKEVLAQVIAAQVGLLPR